MENKLKFMDNEVYERICTKIIIQAVKDFAFPKRMENVERKYLRLCKRETDSAIHIARMFRAERVKIIKSLQSDYMMGLTDGKSIEIARKLTIVLNDPSEKSMKDLQLAIRKADREEK